MAIYVPIVMYGLRLFTVVLQELHCLPNIYHDVALLVMECVFLYEIRELKLKNNMKNSEN